MHDSKLASWARGYESEGAVFDAVAAGQNFAVVDPTVLNGFSAFGFMVDVDVEDKRFDAFELQFRDVTTGREGRVTVIGVLAVQLSPDLVAGIYVPESAYSAVFGRPDYLRTYVKLDDGVNAANAARDIEGALVTQGIQADSTKQLLDEAVSQNNAFIRMFQGFMALGLFTGIAALGVIAYRSVVERRQQIGMLRAIGYQTSTVSLTFILESGFIALMGILSGVVGGMIIARNLFTSGQFSEEGAAFAIPWVEILLIAGTAFVVSLIMTWWPSRRAARVPVADALRYE
jgi:putative ABC transport system permease protein